MVRSLSATFAPYPGSERQSVTILEFMVDSEEGALAIVVDSDGDVWTCALSALKVIGPGYDLDMGALPPAVTA